MLNDHDLREKLSAYVAREISLASLERWLNAASQPLVADRDDPGFRLLASVNLLISERHDDLISADEFRREASSLLNNIVIDVTSARFTVRKRTAMSAPAWISFPSELPTLIRRVPNVVVATGNNASLWELPQTA